MPSALQLPELLAPAGNPSMLRAAVRGGANAVYLGLQSFNARRNAGNFDDETLSEAVRYCHLRNVKVYVTMNTLILQSEMEEAISCAKTASRLGVDAFIVQDLGLLCRLREACPQVRLHASTQMSIHSLDGLRACAQLGVKRVTLARELSLPEISLLCEEAHSLGMQIEVFAHGAICICYSGQCLMSSLIGARSANRGLCAQPCRLAYKLEDPDSPDRTLRSPGDHLLSPKDLCTISDLASLVDAGVDSLKIEGRMKSPEYVFTTASVYREALDRLAVASADSVRRADAAADGSVSSAAGSPCALEAEGSGGLDADDDGVYGSASRVKSGSFKHREFEGASIKKLQSVFSRGFTAGYLHADRSNEVMAYQRPNNRGESVGRVKSVKDGVMRFTCNRELMQGDVLEVWTGRGNVIVPVGSEFSQTARGAHVFLPDDFASAGSAQGNVALGRGKAVKPGNSSGAGKRAAKGGSRTASWSIQEGDRVFRVRSADAAYEDDDREPRIGVVGAVELRIGQPLRMSFSPVVSHSPGWVASGCATSGDAASSGASTVSASAEGPMVESARTKSVSAAEVTEHVDRLGQTPFRIERLDVALDDNVGIGFSQLHRCRAAALANLEDAILDAYGARVASSERDGGEEPCRIASVKPCSDDASRAGLEGEPDSCGASLPACDACSAFQAMGDRNRSEDEGRGTHQEPQGGGEL